MSYPQEFQRFWEIYPKRVGKAAALRAWQRTSADRPPLERLLEAVHAQSSWQSWTAESGQYIPHPATWLNQHRWEDELPSPRAQDQLVAAGWRNPEPVRLDVGELLARLVARLPQHPSLETTRKALLDMDPEQGAECIESRLEELDQEALKQVWESLDGECKRRLRSQIEATHKRLSQRLDSEELARARSRIWRQLVRQEFDLPVLSLFS